MIVRLKDAGDTCPCCKRLVKVVTRESGKSGGARCKMQVLFVRVIVHDRSCELFKETHPTDMLAPTGRVTHVDDTHPAHGSLVK